MKKIAILIGILLLSTISLCAQNTYWVVFADKGGTDFDPYAYFDAKAIERYNLCGANLYDISNYPVSENYVATVEGMSQEMVGTSRWLNAAGIVASEEQIEKIKVLNFVKSIYLIENEVVLANTQAKEVGIGHDFSFQIKIHNGELFSKNKITGKGVRIAVFDGGFKEANTHPAFKHLFDNKQIIKTWNFVNKNENVYLGHSHGRMVLSCIAGIRDDTTFLGMAPDAEFLLARTEVLPEKKKEEIWWVAALEWADQNGADIVNSSLGYGMPRYDLKHMDGKTSIVAKAANTAARKGILVCNSMGNEGNDSEWKMLITPADADSILSVGAVSDIDRRSYFSSFGPTADRRMKPNVVALGHCNVAGNNGNFTYADGTSFSSPMVAGFAACVKQLHPEYTALMLKEEIEKSGNHYPYFDYAFGYGVPQANYFFNTIKEKKDVFTIKEDESKIYFIPTKKDSNLTVFYKIVNGDNTISKYEMKRLFSYYDPEESEAVAPQYISKNNLEQNQRIEIWCNGQYEVYKPDLQIQEESDTLLRRNSANLISYPGIEPPESDIYTRPFKTVYKTHLVLNFAFVLPTMWDFNGSNWNNERMSRTLTFAWDNNWHFAKHYGIGFRIGFGSSWYAIKPILTNDFDPNHNYSVDLVKNNIKITKFDLEFYQRFFLSRVGKLYWCLDTGVFGEWNVGRRYKFVSKDGNIKETFVQRKTLPYDLAVNRFDCGVRMRIGITRSFAIFGQYRITRLLKNSEINGAGDLPKWEVGIQLF